VSDCVARGGGGGGGGVGGWGGGGGPGPGGPIFAPPPPPPHTHLVKPRLDVTIMRLDRQVFHQCLCFTKVNESLRFTTVSRRILVTVRVRAEETLEVKRGAHRSHKVTSFDPRASVDGASNDQITRVHAMGPV
jgi:hypothetical protein